MPTSGKEPEPIGLRLVATEIAGKSVSECTPSDVALLVGRLLASPFDISELVVHLDCVRVTIDLPIGERLSADAFGAIEARFAAICDGRDISREEREGEQAERTYQVQVLDAERHVIGDVRGVSADGLRSAIGAVHPAADEPSTEAERVALYKDLIGRGLSDYEARGTAWPADEHAAAAAALAGRRGVGPLPSLVSAQQILSVVNDIGFVNHGHRSDSCAAMAVTKQVHIAGGPGYFVTCRCGGSWTFRADDIARFPGIDIAGAILTVQDATAARAAGVPMSESMAKLADLCAASARLAAGALASKQAVLDAAGRYGKSLPFIDEARTIFHDETTAGSIKELTRSEHIARSHATMKGAYGPTVEVDERGFIVGGLYDGRPLTRGERIEIPHGHSRANLVDVERRCAALSWTLQDAHRMLREQGKPVPSCDTCALAMVLDAGGFGPDAKVDRAERDFAAYYASWAGIPELFEYLLEEPKILRRLHLAGIPERSGPAHDAVLAEARYMGDRARVRAAQRRREASQVQGDAPRCTRCGWPLDGKAFSCTSDSCSFRCDCGPTHRAECPLARTDGSGAVASEAEATYGPGWVTLGGVATDEIPKGSQVDLEPSTGNVRRSQP